MALIDNLVSYWKMDEVSGNRADAHGSNTLTDVNTVASTTGIINNGADFETSNNERLTTSTPFTTATTDFSVSFWVKLESLSAFNALIQNGRQTNFWWIFTNITTGLLSFAENDIAQYDSSASLATNTWYHVVVVKSTNSGTNLTFYVNAVTSGTASVGSITTPATNAYVGGFSGDNSIFLYTLDGIFDEFGVWSRALAGSEVTQLYNSGAGLAYPFTGAAVNSNFLAFM